MQRVNEGFNEDEAQLILQIKPGGIKAKVSFSWIHDKQGHYSVKSGYWIWQSRIKFLEEASSVRNPSTNLLFSELWRVKAPPKVKHFLWRCLSDSLAVGNNMRMKRLTKDGLCFRCTEKDESVNHLLFGCPFSRLVWALSPFGSLFHPLPNNSLLENFSILLFPAIVKHGDGRESEKAKFWPWILWMLWKSRNDLMFTCCKELHVDVLQRASGSANEWHQANVTPSFREPSLPNNKKWIPPEPNSYKCNVDGSWKKGSNRSGIGWILRDHKGSVRQLGTKCLPGLFSPLETEAAALVWAVSCITIQGITNVVFETDCSDVIQAVENPHLWPRLQTFSSEIIGMTSTDLTYAFKFSKRECNVCADVIAKHITLCPIYFAILDISLPSWLTPLGNMDASSIPLSSIN